MQCLELQKKKWTHSNVLLQRPWEKNARLIPTGRDKNGLPTYINYSYTNPYDMLERTLTGALNKVEEGQKLGKSGDVIAFEAKKRIFK